MAEAVLATPGLEDVRGVLIDVDGVLTTSWRALPGAVETLASLRRAEVPFRLLTNTTSLTRRELADTLVNAGFEIARDDIITAPSATARYLAAKHPGSRCQLIVTGNIAQDFDEIELVARDAEVVVVGGAEENFTYEALNEAFRSLMNGAALVAMHRNLYWKTDEGLTLDAGAFVRALEEAAGVEAVVIGKPRPEFFAAGVDALQIDRGQVAMIGDDLNGDVLAAQRAGLRGVLVRTGKFRESQLDDADEQPDVVLDSFAALQL